MTINSDNDIGKDGDDNDFNDYVSNNNENDDDDGGGIDKKTKKIIEKDNWGGKLIKDIFICYFLN